MNTLFSKKLISVFLTVLIIISTFSIAFAESDEPAAGSEVSSDPAPVQVTSSNVEQELLAPDLRNPVYLKVAQELKASSATTYDIDDIYLAVQECANALLEYDGSEFVSVTEYVHACLSGLANGLFNGSSSNPYLGSINSNIASIQAAVYGPAWDGSGVTNSLWNALQTLYSVNHADQLAQMAKQQGIIDALVGNTQYSLSNKLTNLQDNYNNISWVNWVTVNNAVYSDINLTTPITQVGNYNKAYFKVTVYSGGLTSAFLPFRPNTYASVNPNIKFYDRGRQLNLPFYYDVVNTGIYVNFDGGNVYGNQNITIEINPGHSWYLNNTSVTIRRLDSDTQDYYTVLDNLIISHIDNDIHFLSGGIDKLVQMYASDDELAAKQAQQQFEQDSLTDFTGGGSAAASGTDRNGLKSVSNTAKSGFDSGGSISDGLSVFNSNNSIWGWFSQDNASYFTTNRSLMKSNNNSELITEIPDYLSTSDKYMIDNLGDNNDKSYCK